MATEATMRDFWDTRTDTSSAELEPSQILFADALCRAAQGRSVLDCGTGGGALAAYVARSARRVIGVDFSAPMIELARSRFRHVRFGHGDALTMHLGERFDIICGIGFLHEISVDDTPALIAFLSRHLAPGGFCWFQENSFFNPCARLLRRHVVGRYGVPKYGSAHETPFDPERWALYRVAFRHAVRSAEAFVLWQRVWTYFIRRGPDEPWRALDRICSRLPDPVKRYTSYIQHIYLSHDVPKRLALNQ